MSSTPSLPATELYSPGIKGYVLYVDYQGHPAPLTESFHATASRRLSSTVYRYPLATSQEVDSAYCPQCLTFHDAATAAEIGYCSKVSCRRCPLCLSVASVHTSESTGIQGSSEDDIVCFFQCGLCDWTSKDCDVSVTIPSDGEEHKLGRLELMRAAEDMSTALSDRRKLAMQPIETYHKALTDQWTIYRKQQRQPKTKRVDNDWSLEMLQTKLENLTKTAQDSHNTPDFPNVPNCLQIKHVTIQDILEKLGKADADADDQSAPKVLYPDHVSFLSYHLQSIDAAPLLPLPIPLVLRQSRRCRAELVEGRPGILLKPKLNPLEGDSSLPTGHGQWHRKVQCAQSFSLR